MTLGTNATRKARERRAQESRERRSVETMRRARARRAAGDARISALRLLLAGSVLRAEHVSAIRLLMRRLREATRDLATARANEDSLFGEVADLTIKLREASR